MLQFKKQATDRNDHLIQKKKNYDKFYYTGYLPGRSSDLIDPDDFFNCMERAWLYTAPDDGSAKGFKEF